MLARVDEIVASFAATWDTGDAVDVPNSFETIGLPAIVVMMVATVVVTIDANVLVVAVVSAALDIVDGVLRISFTLLMPQIEKSLF